MITKLYLVKSELTQYKLEQLDAETETFSTRIQTFLHKHIELYYIPNTVHTLIPFMLHVL